MFSDTDMPILLPVLDVFQSKEDLLKLIDEIKTKPVPKNAPPVPAPMDAASTEGISIVLCD